MKTFIALVIAAVVAADAASDREAKMATQQAIWDVAGGSMKAFKDAGFKTPESVFYDKA